jgi:GNAT superfamily N-acetyltransferase
MQAITIQVKGNLLEIYGKVGLDKNTTLLWMFRHRSAVGADFEVKAVLPYAKSDKIRKQIGIAKISIDGRKNAVLHDILVNSPYRRRGVGSKILKFVVDYLQDGDAEIIKGDTRGIDDQQITIKFFLRNGFTMDAENSEFSLILNKPTYSQLGNLYEGIEYIKGNEYRTF